MSEILDLVQKTYALIDQLNISVTGLIAIGIILFAALLYSIRELACWFFKIDEIKKDIRTLTALTKKIQEQLEKQAEVQTKIESLPNLLKEKTGSEEKPVFNINH